jgi:hypothetical protein
LQPFADLGWIVAHSKGVPEKDLFAGELEIVREISTKAINHNLEGCALPDKVGMRNEIGYQFGDACGMLQVMSVQTSGEY